MLPNQSLAAADLPRCHTEGLRRGVPRRLDSRPQPARAAASRARRSAPTPSSAPAPRYMFTNEAGDSYDIKVDEIRKVKISAWRERQGSARRKLQGACLRGSPRRVSCRRWWPTSSSWPANSLEKTQITSRESIGRGHATHAPSLPACAAAALLWCASAGRSRGRRGGHADDHSRYADAHQRRRAAHHHGRNFKPVREEHHHLPLRDWPDRVREAPPGEPDEAGRSHPRSVSRLLAVGSSGPEADPPEAPRARRQVLEVHRRGACRRWSPVSVVTAAAAAGGGGDPAVVCNNSADHDGDLLSNTRELQLGLDPCPPTPTGTPSGTARSTSPPSISTTTRARPRCPIPASGRIRTRSTRPTALPRHGLRRRRPDAPRGVSCCG